MVFLVSWTRSACPISRWCWIGHLFLQLRPDATLLFILFVAAPGTAIYLWTPRIFPDQIWAMRRFLPAALPLFIIFAALTVDVIVKALATIELGIRFRHWFWAAAAASLLVFPLGSIWRVRNSETQAGYISAIYDICEGLDDAAVAFVPSDRAYLFAQTLRGWCDIPTGRLVKPLTSSELVELADYWSTRERTFWIVGETSEALAAAAPERAERRNLARLSREPKIDGSHSPRTASRIPDRVIVAVRRPRASIREMNIRREARKGIELTYPLRAIRRAMRRVILAAPSPIQSRLRHACEMVLRVLGSTETGTETAKSVRPSDRAEITRQKIIANEDPPIKRPPSRQLPMPEGLRSDDIESIFRSWSVNDEPVGHLDGYVSDSICRFLHTWGLVKDETGSCLELGSNPYFTTYLLGEFTSLDVSLANYYEQRGRTSETISFRVPGSPRRTMMVRESEMFNVEEDRFPYADGSFSVVLFCEMIEHLLMNPVTSLHEIHRVLISGGTLVVTTPNVVRLGNVAAIFDGRNIYDPYSGYGPYGRHNREYTCAELLRLLKFTGFEPVEWFTAEGQRSDTAWTSRRELAPVLAARPEELGQYLFVKARSTANSAERSTNVSLPKLAIRPARRRMSGAGDAPSGTFSTYRFADNSGTRRCRDRQRVTGSSLRVSRGPSNPALPPRSMVRSRPPWISTPLRMIASTRCTSTASIRSIPARMMSRNPR